jgi:hypothetical protein
MKTKCYFNLNVILKILKRVVEEEEQELNSSVTSCNKARRGGKNYWQYSSDWNGKSWFWPDRNSLEGLKLVLAWLEWLGMEKVSFGLTGTVWNAMEEVGFVLSRMAWNWESQFWPAWNGLECQKSILAWLEWLGIEQVVFGMTGMAWKEGSRFWSDWNSLDCRKSGLDCLLLWLGPS